MNYYRTNLCQLYSSIRGAKSQKKCDRNHTFRINIMLFVVGVKPAKGLAANSEIFCYILFWNFLH